MQVVGARPQFVKLAPLCPQSRRRTQAAAIDSLVVHTGQHYDPAMSDVFFAELGIPAPTSTLASDPDRTDARPRA